MIGNYRIYGIELDEKNNLKFKNIKLQNLKKEEIGNCKKKL